MGGDVAALVEAARKLRAARPAGKAPSLFAFTDPQRTRDPLSLARRLPAGAALVYRHFGAADAPAVAMALRRITRERGGLLLIGDDERLAASVRADGLHLPERRVGAVRRIRARRPGWIVTVAAHGARALRAAEGEGADAAVLSSAFESRSASAGRPLGPLRLAALARGVGVPVIALGGVNARTARRLVGTGAAGLAAVEAWLDA